MKIKNPFRMEIKGSHTLIIIGVGFSLFYWILESVRDVFVFHRGTLIQRLFVPDPMGFYMRLLVVCLIILFSVQAQTARNRVQKKPPQSASILQMNGIIITGFGFGAFYWLLEAFRDTFVFGRGNFWERLLSPDPMYIWMRLLAVCIIILFSIYAQALVNARKEAEWALQLKSNELEKRVQERTADLTRSNLLLRQEIMERQQRDTELRIMGSAITSSINGIALTNMEGELTYVNPAFLRMWDFEKEKDLLGQKILKMWMDRSRAEEIMKSLYEKGSWIGELEARSKTGEAFHVEASMNVVRDSGGQPLCMMGSFLNITERYKAEQEKEAIQAQLIQAQKMEAVGILSGGIAHDFNNFLTAIQVSTDLAMMQVDEAAPVYNDLNEVHKLTSKAADLIRQLLLFSRKHHLEMARQDLNRIIEDLSRMLDHLIGEDISVATKLQKNLWPIKADRGTMEQVVMNLSVNARDAMPKGGKLIIHTENCIVTEAMIKKIPGAQSGEYVCLTIEDTGIGMSSEVMKQIFDPFFSTKGPGKGSGLGLSVVYGIVKQHKGWIHVTSKVGQGSTFKVYLPVMTQGEVPIEEVIFKKEGSMSTEKRILFIEDEEKIREFTARGLSRLGFEVFSASSAEEASKLFNAQKGNFHLVVSDVVLPDRNGVDLVEEFIHDKPGLKVLLSSGYTDHKSMWPAIQEKGYQFLVKPYTLNDLIKAIDTAVA